MAALTMARAGSVWIKGLFTSMEITLAHLFRNMDHGQFAKPTSWLSRRSESCVALEFRLVFPCL
jgi:hypothetical protein